VLISALTTLLVVNFLGQDPNNLAKTIIDKEALSSLCLCEYLIKCLQTQTILLLPGDILGLFTCGFNVLSN
jgi:hypothetical protein